VLKTAKSVGQAFGAGGCGIEPSPALSGQGGVRAGERDVLNIVIAAAERFGESLVMTDCEGYLQSGREDYEKCEILWPM